MTTSLSTNGAPIRLGAVLASAGEGVIHEVVDRPDVVAKVFHRDLKDRAAKIAKVGAMIETPPDGIVQSDGFVVLTWPTALLDERDGAVGYLMPRIDTSDAVEIHTLSNPANRANPLPSAPVWTPNVTWSHLVNVAANLCLAVETVHRVDAVIGDFQERNILVNDTTRVTLVDCDSMQFTDASGRQYLCGVARPEFTAPELARVNLAVTARAKPSDLFALAVHIHLLLMAGNHPFLRGEWTGGGDQPDALTLAVSGQWAGGPRSALHTHPLAPPITFLPYDIERLFVRAFTGGARDPEARPTAAEWRNALSGIQIGTCARGHQIPAEADPCPWCVIEDQRAARRGVRSSYPAFAPIPDQVIYRASNSPAPAVPARKAAAPQLTVSGSTNGSTNKLLGGISLFALLSALIATLVFVDLDDDSRSSGEAASSSRAGSTVEEDDPFYITTIPTQAPAVANASPPANAKPCGTPIAAMYARAATGTPVTSCPFALSVRDAVNATGQDAPRTVNAYSPVTRKWYPMACVMEDVLTCRGGQDAVVYLY